MWYSTIIIQRNIEPGRLLQMKKLLTDFLNHTNSARVSGNPDPKNVTSYFTIIFYDRIAQ